MLLPATSAELRLAWNQSRVSPRSVTRPPRQIRVELRDRREPAVRAVEELLLDDGAREAHGRGCPDIRRWVSQVSRSRDRGAREFRRCRSRRRPVGPGWPPPFAAQHRKHLQPPPTQAGISNRGPDGTHQEFRASSSKYAAGGVEPYCSASNSTSCALSPPAGSPAIAAAVTANAAATRAATAICLKRDPPLEPPERRLCRASRRLRFVCAHYARSPGDRHPGPHRPGSPPPQRPCPSTSS